MGRPSNATARRLQIVEAALRVVGASGYAGATTTAIAAAAGLAPGLIHYHFADKRSILLALLEHLAVVMQRRFAARVVTDDLPMARLEAWVDARLALGDDADPLAVAAWVMIGREAIRDSEVRSAFEAVLARELAQLRELLAAALGAGAEPHQVDRLALGALSMAEGCFMLASSAGQLLLVGSAAPLLKEWLRAALGVPISTQGRKP